MFTDVLELDLARSDRIRRDHQRAESVPRLVVAWSNSPRDIPPEPSVCVTRTPYEEEEVRFWGQLRRKGTSLGEMFTSLIPHRATPASHAGFAKSDSM